MQVSKNFMKNHLGKHEKVNKFNKAFYKLMIIPRTTEYDMKLWRRCDKGHGLMYGSLDK